MFAGRVCPLPVRDLLQRRVQRRLSRRGTSGHRAELTFDLRIDVLLRGGFAFVRCLSA